MLVAKQQAIDERDRYLQAQRLAAESMNKQSASTAGE
jgi:hypothetical protein